MAVKLPEICFKKKEYEKIPLPPWLVEIVRLNPGKKSECKNPPDCC